MKAFMVAGFGAWGERIGSSKGAVALRLLPLLPRVYKDTVLKP